MPMPSLAIASAMGCEHAGLIVALAVLLLGATLEAAAADTAPAARIYRCIVDGKKVTRDRPIAECADRVQYLLNADGSVNREVQPTLTVEEREKKEQADLVREYRDAQVKQDIRADRNLLQLYPNEAAHKRARDKGLDDARVSVEKLEKRIAELTKDRKPLLDDAEFYVNKPLPSKLKASLESNEVTLKAQRDLLEKQQAEVARINTNYDVELARLRKLWAGAQPGSLGPLPGTQPAVAGPVPPPAAVTARTPDSAGKTTVK